MRIEFRSALLRWVVSFVVRGETWASAGRMLGWDVFRCRGHRRTHRHGIALFLTVGMGGLGLGWWGACAFCAGGGCARRTGQFGQFWP